MWDGRIPTLQSCAFRLMMLLDGPQKKNTAKKGQKCKYVEKKRPRDSLAVWPENMRSFTQDSTRGSLELDALFPFQRRAQEPAGGWLNFVSFRGV